MPPRVRRGLFITVEGGDGSGKSTHAARLGRWLRRQGYAVCLTREPGGTRLGERIRLALLTYPRLTKETELLLFEALRAQHVAEVIRPRLADGEVVICDRYADSTMAYQGYGLGLDRTEISKITWFATRGLTPDLTLILDESAETGLQRSRHRQLMERRGVAFQRRVCNGFLKICRDDPRRCKRIVVQSDPRSTQQLIRDAVENALSRRHRA